MMRCFVRNLIGAFFAGALLWSTAPPALAQGTGSIRGRIVDTRSGRPLRGAEILLAGRNRPVLSDNNGEYALSDVPPGTATIIVRLIGYAGMGQQLTVQSGQTAQANFELARSAISLDEVVVTGQARAVEQRKIAAKVDVLTAQQIERAPVMDVAQLLQGTVAGATVNATSAQAGTSGIINFRGVTSVFGSQTPVIYIDGIRVDNNDITSSGTGGEESSALAELVTSDIDRVEITKGGAASTLYGSDAASGVIQIFTKRGRPGPPRVTFRIEQGADVPELKYMFDTGLIYPDEIDDGADPEFLQNNFFQTGHFQNYYLGVEGGREDITYSVSGRIQQADGVQLENNSELFYLRGNVSVDASQKVSFNFNANYTRSEFQRLFNGQAIADPLTSFEVGDVFFFSQEDNFDDALEVFLLPDIDEQINRFRLGTSVDFRPHPVFSGRATIGLDYRTNQQREFSPIGAVIINAGQGQLQRFQRDFLSVTGDASGTISYPNEGWLTSDFTFGVQGFRDDVAITNITGQTFALPGAPDFDEAATTIPLETNTEIFNGGFYFLEQVSLGDRFFVNGGFRIDANSAFGNDVDLEVYPKAGVSYVISDESFFQQALGSVMNTLRLRLAYGQTGKFPTPFLRDRSFSATQFRGESAPRFNNPGNQDLTAERTETIEFGFDAAALDNRIGLGFTYYDAKTKDALFFVPEQPVTGLGTQLRNVGELSNTGIEFDANADILRGTNVQWRVGMTYQAVKNRVTSLGGEAPFNIPGTGGQQRVEEGHVVGAWRVFTPIDSDDPDNRLDDSEQQFTGKGPTPTKSGSFNTNVTLWGRLNISTTFEWATGHQVFDWGSIWATFNNILRRELVEFEDQNGNGIRDKDASDNFTEPGYDFPRQFDTDGNDLGVYSQNAARSEFVLDGDWLKWRNLSVRYSIPESVPAKIGLDRATVYVTGRNLKIWSDNPLIDPELNGVSANGNLQLGAQSSVTLSPARQWRFGLEVIF